ncbi:MAG: pseudouridine synthase family protein, partial [Bdellovibrionales bacterium]
MKTQELKSYFNSSDVLIVEKPAGYLSVPSILGKKDSRPVVGLIAQDQWGPLFPVHRLDLEVPGLLVFAKNSKSHKVLQHLWEKKGVKKIYRALSGLQNFSHWPENVFGAEKDFKLTSDSELWKSKIVQGKRRSFVADHGLESLTEYKLLKTSQSLNFWELSPITGRRHQLRLEMSRHGFPIA